MALGRFTTQRVDDAGFTAALMTVSHTGTCAEGRPELDVLDSVVRNVRQDQPESLELIGDGNGANETETLYGRGGGRAAQVGEQARVHQLMLDTGVQIFFFGHDHVFVDQVVNGIHYAPPGSCGAPWRFGREITGYTTFWSDAGHARLSVRPDRATVSYVNQSGDVFHEFAVAARA